MAGHELPELMVQTEQQIRGVGDKGNTGGECYAQQVQGERPGHDQHHGGQPRQGVAVKWVHIAPLGRQSSRAS